MTRSCGMPPDQTGLSGTLMEASLPSFSPPPHYARFSVPSSPTFPFVDDIEIAQERWGVLDRGAVCGDDVLLTRLAKRRKPGIDYYGLRYTLNGCGLSLPTSVFVSTAECAR